MFSIFKKRKLFNQLLFDADFYKNNNEELQKKSLSEKQLRRHFTQIGLSEGRCASPVFDAAYYLEKNEDVKARIGGDNYKKAAKHFLEHGVHENRRTSHIFDVGYYYNENPDLQTAFGRNYLSLYRHFMQDGRHENRRSNPNAMPDSFMIELTNMCNLHCTTCPREYKYGADMDVGSMDRVALNALLEQMLPLSESINLTGLGETFLYRELPRVLEEIDKRKPELTTFLSTNAQTSNCCAVFKEIKDKINLVQISIDGVGATYEKVRNRASFVTFAQNVKEMSALAERTKTSLMFNMVAFQDNFETIPDVVRFAHQVGVRHVHINSRNLVTMPEIDLSLYAFYRSEPFVNSMEKGRALAQELGIGFSTYSTKGYCELVYNHFYITWDGFLVPCCAKPFPKELHFGNVFKESLQTCIRKYQNSEFRRCWDNGEVPDFCRRCHVAL